MTSASTQLQIISPTSTSVHHVSWVDTMKKDGYPSFPTNSSFPMAPPLTNVSPPILRRSRSLPAHLQTDGTSKSLFWFRPNPNRPLTSPRLAKSSPNRQLRTSWRRRRQGFTASNELYKQSPRNPLCLPSLDEEKDQVLCRQDSLETETSDDYSDSEDGMDLRGLSLLE